MNRTKEREITFTEQNMDYHQNNATHGVDMNQTHGQPYSSTTAGTNHSQSETAHYATRPKPRTEELPFAPTRSWLGGVNGSTRPAKLNFPSGPS